MGEEHGVNALEIIANLAGGIAAATSSGDTGRATMFKTALANLTKAYPGPDYYGNLINLRIQVRKKTAVATLRCRSQPPTPDVHHHSCEQK